MERLRFSGKEEDATAHNEDLRNVATCYGCASLDADVRPETDAGAPLDAGHQACRISRGALVAPQAWTLPD